MNGASELYNYMRRYGVFGRFYRSGEFNGVRWSDPMSEPVPRYFFPQRHVEVLSCILQGPGGEQDTDLWFLDEGKEGRDGMVRCFYSRDRGFSISWQLLLDRSYRTILSMSIPSPIPGETQIVTFRFTDHPAYLRLLDMALGRGTVAKHESRKEAQALREAVRAEREADRLRKLERLMVPPPFEPIPLLAARAETVAQPAPLAPPAQPPDHAIEPPPYAPDEMVEVVEVVDAVDEPPPY